VLATSFYTIAYYSIAFFYFPVCLRVCDGGEIEFDAHAFKVVFEFLGCEVCSIVRNYVVWYPKAEYYLLDEVDCCYGILGCYWSCFYPLGEFVDCDQHIDMPTWPRFMQFSHHI
jgi:hypothetical protein